MMAFLIGGEEFFIMVFLFIIVNLMVMVFEEMETRFGDMVQAQIVSSFQVGLWLEWLKK